MHKDEILTGIRTRIQSDAFRHELTELLVGIMQEDTTPRNDIEQLSVAENSIFDQLIQAATIRGTSGLDISRRNISARIKSHPHYTAPWYAKGAVRPTYERRHNLVMKWSPQASGPTVAVNTHVDTVAPYLAPATHRGTILGRGACDAKGCCAAAIGALILLQELTHHGAEPAVGGVEFQFVIDEEMGGNGSLAIAVEAEDAFDAAIVVEPTDLQIHPGNRGAIWYEVTADTLGNRDLSPAEMALAAVLAIEEEGRKIKAESDHPLFPDRPVQTCHGILGPFGEHTSRTCGKVILELRPAGRTTSEQEMRNLVTSAIDAYCADYPHRTKVSVHYEIEKTHHSLLLTIHAKAGHMASADELDNAIIKAAYVARALSPSFRVDLADVAPDARQVRLKGGQGFLPTHPMEIVKERITRAVSDGVHAFVRALGVEFRQEMAHVTFGMLHNEPFACDPQSEAALGLVHSAKQIGINVKQPLIGFNASCDARIFAHFFPGSTVLTFGPGKAVHAHADDEQIEIADIARAAGAICGFLMGI